MVFSTYKLDDPESLRLLFQDLMDEFPEDDTRKRTLESLQEHVTDTNNQADDFESTIDDLNDTIHSLEGEKEELENDLNDAQEEIDELKEQLAEAKA